MENREELVKHFCNEYEFDISVYQANKIADFIIEDRKKAIEEGKRMIINENINWLDEGSRQAVQKIKDNLDLLFNGLEK